MSSADNAQYWMEWKMSLQIGIEFGLNWNFFRSQTTLEETTGVGFFTGQMEDNHIQMFISSSV